MFGDAMREVEDATARCTIIALHEDINMALAHPDYAETLAGDGLAVHVVAVRFDAVDLARQLFRNVHVRKIASGLLWQSIASRGKIALATERIAARAARVKVGKRIVEGC